MTKNRYEVTFEYGSTTRSTRIFELYSEFEAQSAISCQMGQNDIRILNIRRV